VVTVKAVCSGMKRRSAVRVRTVIKPAMLPATCQIRNPRQFGLKADTLKAELAMMLNNVLTPTRASRAAVEVEDCVKVASQYLLRNMETSSPMA
jgi:hypothetical protein